MKLHFGVSSPYYVRLATSWWHIAPAMTIVEGSLKAGLTRRRLLAIAGLAATTRRF